MRKYLLLSLVFTSMFALDANNKVVYYGDTPDTVSYDANSERYPQKPQQGIVTEKRNLHNK